MSDSSDSEEGSPRRREPPPGTPPGAQRGRLPETPSTADGGDAASPRSGGVGGGGVVPPTPFAAPAGGRGGRGRGGGGDDDDDDPTTPLTPLSALDEGSQAPTPRSPNDHGEGGGVGVAARQPPPLPRLPDNGGDDDDDDDNAFQAQENQPPQQHVRGTDVHVPTAAAAFRDFLRTFRSLRHSQRQQRRRRGRSRGGRGGGASASGESDDSSEEEEDADDDAPPLYLSRLRAILAQGTAATSAPRSLDVDTMHVYYHSPECQRFYRQLVAYPSELVPVMDFLVQRELERLAASEGGPGGAAAEAQQALPQMQVRPYNLKSVSNLRCLDPVDMDSLVAIKGMVVRCSPVIPDLKVAYFSCVICGDAQTRQIERGRIAEPTRCPQCATKRSYEIQHNRGAYADKQLVRVQETPDRVPAGQTPASLTAFCFDDLVDGVQPGDRVEITGVLRAQPVRVNPRISKVKSVYKTYVDVIHFRKVAGMESDQDRLDRADAGAVPAAAAASAPGPAAPSRRLRAWTPQRVAQLEELSRDPDVYGKLVRSLAPSIWELDNVKRGVLCMLFGGNHVRVKDGGGGRRRRSDRASSGGGRRLSSASRGHGSDGDDDDNDSWLNDDDDDLDGDGADRTATLHKRGDINILLCGDPGTSKSQLLTYVHKLSHRGVYTSGKGSSAVGLTASVVRDPETRDLVLESGALVLSDQGICCIDEFDKMSDTTRSVLHEAMEQQTVSIAKAGIIATLHARTSVLASANPTESRYNPNISVVENIQLPPTLLSRFDLIYLILDSPNVEHDRRLAQHLVGLYYETPNIVEPPLDQNLLKDYIEYARENIHPSITDGAANVLINSYLEMRNPGGGAAVGSHGTRTISATPRQLESLVRLSEALAKMRYSPCVQERDAREAVRLMQVATQAAATDPRTGRIDMDMIATGRSAADRHMEEQVAAALKELLMERRGSRMAVREVERQLGEITNTTPSHDTVVEMLRRFEDEGIVQWNAHAQTIYVQTGLGR